MDCSASCCWGCKDDQVDARVEGGKVCWSCLNRLIIRLAVCSVARSLPAHKTYTNNSPNKLTKKKGKTTWETKPKILWQWIIPQQRLQLFSEDIDCLALKVLYLTCEYAIVFLSTSVHWKMNHPSGGKKKKKHRQTSANQHVPKVPDLYLSTIAQSWSCTTLASIKSPFIGKQLNQAGTTCQTSIHEKR